MRLRFAGDGVIGDESRVEMGFAGDKDKFSGNEEKR